MKAPVSLCLHQYLVFSVFSVLQPVCHILLISIRIWLIHTLKDFFSLCSFSFSHVVLYCLFGLILKSEFSSVTQSCPTLCNPMDCSKPGFPVCHQLLELAQTHVHWVGEAIKPSHPLLSPDPPLFNLPQHQGLFQWVSSSHQVVKILEFHLKHQSFQWIFRTYFL